MDLIYRRGLMPEQGGSLLGRSAHVSEVRVRLPPEIVQAPVILCDLLAILLAHGAVLSRQIDILKTPPAANT